MKLKDNWTKIIMGLVLFVLGYIAVEIREVRKVAHDVDKRTALLEYRIETLDGKIDDPMRIVELLKKIKE